MTARAAPAKIRFIAYSSCYSFILTENWKISIFRKIYLQKFSGSSGAS
ncbi:hypothetical protein TREPR_3847 [Treponema primitia ZAS-2]|uniref:Uncharacterized protein n=1 Tax=Treponema primitia (strain ATCC BAA-887 / DSM 12427 / ZAS-2) TaxID=545694 RepID=F5YP47_TREPZ|nr:hypothetical protein TREPR_3847 [Treponema primitia ZAS-2]